MVQIPLTARYHQVNSISYYIGIHKRTAPVFGVWLLIIKPFYEATGQSFFAISNSILWYYAF
jgi:hypothetical protein